MECTECPSQFMRISDLRKHARKFHPEKVDHVAPLKRHIQNYKFTCRCGKNFNHKKTFNAHLKKTHRDTPGTKSNTNGVLQGRKFKKCPLCSYQCSVLHDHFQNKHNIEIVEQKLDFESFSAFELWKDAMEKETKSKYIKKRYFVKKGSTQSNYFCHRSGFFISEGKNIRHLKTQGSKKINAYCPAEIKLLINQDGKCNVSFIKTHIGHTNDDLAHLTLSASERKSVAVKIASKIPFPAIIDEVRDKINDDSLNRFDLLTKKDLYNIEAAYNLKSNAVRHQNDGISVDAWVREMSEGNSCVLFYKPQDTTIEDHPELKFTDFVLCIMNDGQSHMLKKFGGDCICIDGTHGMNNYNFEIHTLLILDDMREGFPCAFLISNRSDQEIFKLFFQVIKRNIGITIKPKVFMSDMALAYYNAWIQVMDKAEYRLFCSWHVLRAWGKHILLIPSKEKQQEVHATLRTLLEETDEKAFEIMINKFITKIAADPETNTFSNYFKQNYLQNSNSWAYCKRVYCGLNTNMHLERMHGTIKYVYLQGKTVKRLDKSINCIMRFVRDKLFERIITLHKGKLTRKIVNIRSRHKTSLQLNTDSICENNMGWTISSTSNSFELYNIQKNDTNCNCQLMCTDCNICIHQYSCSCMDSAIKWNLCKHVHLLCRFLNSKSPEDTEECQNDMDIDDDDNLHVHLNPKQEESEIILKLLGRGEIETGPKNNQWIDQRKEKLRQHFNSLLDQINTEAQILALEKLIAPCEATLSAVCQEDATFNFNKESEKKIPANKKIVPQRRLYATKKRSQKRQTSLKIPSLDERNKIAIALLNNEPAVSTWVSSTNNNNNNNN